MDRVGPSFLLRNNLVTQLRHETLLYAINSPAFNSGCAFFDRILVDGGVISTLLSKSPESCHCGSHYGILHSDLVDARAFHTWPVFSKESRNRAGFLTPLSDVVKREVGDVAFQTERNGMELPVHHRIRVVEVIVTDEEGVWWCVVAYT